MVSKSPRERLTSGRNGVVRKAQHRNRDGGYLRSHGLSRLLCSQAFGTASRRRAVCVDNDKAFHSQVPGNCASHWSTDHVPAVIHALIAVDNVDDPVSIGAFLAADVLVEMEDPPLDLREEVFQHLSPRLKSSVPMVAYEAGEKLRPLITLCPAVIGPMALNLASHDQRWTKEIACALGLLAGDEYVDVDALLAVYPTLPIQVQKPAEAGD